MNATMLPQAVGDWLAMLDQAEVSIGRALAEADAHDRQMGAEKSRGRGIEKTVKRCLNQLDQRLEKLTLRLDEAGNAAAEVGAELTAAEETLRTWVGSVAAAAARLSAIPELPAPHPRGSLR